MSSANTCAASTVHIRRSDEAFDMVVAWLSTHGLDSASRSTIARAGLKRDVPGRLHDDTKKPVTFSPWNGSFLFWFRKHLLSYRSELKDAGFHKEEEISITSAGRSCRIVKEFIRDCRDEYLRQVSNKTTIFENRGDHWKKVATKTVRPLSTIIISGKQKQQLIADLKDSWTQKQEHGSLSAPSLIERDICFMGPPEQGNRALVCLWLASSMSTPTSLVCPV